MFAASAAILLALVFFALRSPHVYADAPTCGFLQDCEFDHFYDPAGACTGVWKCSGGGIGLTPSEGWPKGPALTFAGNAPFDRKVWQTVAVTPGKGYRLSCPFCVVAVDGTGMHDSEVNRLLGIDSMGGTDPNSPNIKWSADFLGKGRFEDDTLQVSEYARSDHITAFIRVINPYEGKHVDVYVDTVSLVENPDMPPIQVSAPTVTPPPPPPTAIPATAKPTREVQPTSEPTLEPTQEVAPTDVPAEPTEESTAKATRAPSRTRVALAQPTTRPARTRVAAAQTASSDASAAPQFSLMELGVIGVLGIAGVGVAVVLVGAAAFLLLRRK